MEKVKAYVYSKNDNGYYQTFTKVLEKPVASKNIKVERLDNVDNMHNHQYQQEFYKVAEFDEWLWEREEASDKEKDLYTSTNYVYYEVRE